MRVLKFIVPADGFSTVSVGGYVKILHLGQQGNNLCMWVLTNNETQVTSVHLRVVCTGERFDDSGLEFLQTVQMNIDEQQLVFHVFNDLK